MLSFDVYIWVMKPLQAFVLSIISGCLLAFAWPTTGITAFIFFAYVPLLFVIEKYNKRKWWLLFVCFFSFNCITTWWIYNSTVEGAIAAIIANSILMCLPIGVYCNVAKKYNFFTKGLVFISMWLLFEHVHLNWQLSWPWLTLGNVFAGAINWVQWYEYTGVAGGSFWVLLVNYLLFVAFAHWSNNKKTTYKLLGFAMLLLIIPMALSYAILSVLKLPTVKQQQLAVTVVQPNIDPYEKFGSLSATQQIEQLLQATGSIDSNQQQLIIWPETALSNAVNQTQILQQPNYAAVYNLIEKNKHTSLLTGIETYTLYGFNKATATARKAADGSFYDVFNAASLLQYGQMPQLYNKSKLVPGVESLPTFLNFLAPVFEQFGGTTGGYGVNDSSTVFTLKNGAAIAPVICYESIYGNYVASYVQKGAQLIAIITNDGWWGNTPGYHQHLAYAQLRAIETRRYIVRSANTGISAVINNKGQLLQQLNWDKQGNLKATVPLNNHITWYVQYGDYLYQLFTLLSCFVLCFLLIQRFRKQQ
jgi:apolipoprotein N-acyltransferase